MNNLMKKTKLARPLLFALVASLLCLPLIGCTGKDGTDNTSEDPTEYVIVIGPNASGEISLEGEAMIKEMEKALEDFDVTLKPIIVDDYSVMAEALLTGTGHIAFGSSSTYAIASMEDDGIIPLFTYARDGDIKNAGYPAFIGTNIANKEDFEGLDGKEALEKLKGKSFAFVSATSTSGRVVPTTTFWEVFGPEGTKDIKNKSDIYQKTIDKGGIFSEVQYSSSHPASVELLANNRVYGGAFCCGFIEGYEDDIYIIHEEQVPGDPYWVNKNNMKEEHINAIVDHFVNLNPENAAHKNLFAPEGVEIQVGDGEGYALAYDERYVAVDPDYYEFIIKMFESED